MSAEAVEALLDDFRSWLRALPAGASPSLPEDDGPDLHTLLGQFIALRHEVNLQTKATRAQQEQTAEALRQLGEAFVSLRQAQSAAREVREASEEEMTRPLLKTLVDLYDALALGAREARRMQESLDPLVDQLAAASEEAFEKEESEPAPLPAAATVSWWRRLLGARPADTAALTDEIARLRSELRKERLLRREQTRRSLNTAEQTRKAAERVRQAVGSLVTGYNMSLQRVERALRQHDLEPLRAVGQPFDPERMEVVEATTESGRPAGEVLEEVRRGYLWKGRVFRYAQVRVARG